MNATFWSNTIWYILLGVSTLIEMIFILKKAKNRKYVIALFLIILGMTFSLDAIICCFLKSYNYYPLIFPQSPIADKLAGNLFSQFSITATAVLVSVLNLNYYWFFIFSAMYGIIEELFLKLGIYSHNWYRTWMTMIGLIPLLGITKKIYKNSLIYTNRYMGRYFFMSYGLYSLHMITVFWLSSLTGLIVPNISILSDDLSSYALIGLSNLFIISITCMFTYFSKLQWLLKTMITLALYVVIYFADKLHLIYIKDGWFLIFATIDIGGMFIYIFILDRLMTNNHKFKTYD